MAFVLFHLFCSANAGISQGCSSKCLDLSRANPNHQQQRLKGLILVIRYLKGHPWVVVRYTAICQYIPIMVPSTFAGRNLHL